MVLCRILSDEAEVHALAAAWRKLQEEVGLSPFTDYDLAMLWWDRIGKPSGAALRVAVCFDADKLVGVVPFAVRRRYGTRVLFLLGHEIYYYRNFLVAHSRYAPILWQAVFNDTSYDVASLKDIHDDTTDYAFLSSIVPPFCRSFASHCELSGRRRAEIVADCPKSLRRHLRKAEGKMGVELEMDSCVFEEAPNEVVDFLVERKAEWVAAGKKKGIFIEKNGKDYFKELIHLMAGKKKAVLFWLRWRGKIAAATFSILEKDVVYAHAVAYDPAAAKLGPGNLVTVEEIVWASEKGYKETNFMEGEEPYKDALGHGRRGVSDFLWGRTWRGKAYFGAFSFLTALRRFRKRVK